MTDEEQTQEENEVPWWQSPDVPEEQRATVTELMDQLENMKLAGESLPRRQVIRMVGVSFYIIFLTYILYMSIGNTFASYSFIFCITGITICLDSLNTSRKLRLIEKGETQK